MRPAARNTPLKLLPDIDVAARERAAQINQPLSTYISILVWNYCQSPTKGMEAEPDSTQLIRVHVPCTIRHSIWKLAVPLVKRSGLSANALIEALIARDLRTAESELVILPAKGVAKVRI